MIPSDNDTYPLFAHEVEIEDTNDEDVPDLEPNDEDVPDLEPNDEDVPDLEPNDEDVTDCCVK